MAGPFERSTKSVIQVGILILATNGLSAAAAVVRPLFPQLVPHSLPPSLLPSLSSFAPSRPSLPLSLSLSLHLTISSSGTDRYGPLRRLPADELPRHRPALPLQAPRPLAPHRAQRSQPPRRPPRRRSRVLHFVRRQRQAAAARRRRRRRPHRLGHRRHLRPRRVAGGLRRSRAQQEREIARRAGQQRRPRRAGRRRARVPDLDAGQRQRRRALADAEQREGGALCARGRARARHGEHIHQVRPLSFFLASPHGPPPSRTDQTGPSLSRQPFARTSSERVVDQVVTHPYNAHAV